MNPIKHIDIFGLLMMVVFKFGWAKPVPVNMSNFKNPKRDMAITAAAGPVSNIILACVMLFIYGLVFTPLYDSGAVGDAVSQMLVTTAYISVALAIFNFLPIPPLDGSKVLFSLLPNQAYVKLMRYERYGMILLLLIVSTDLIGQPLSNCAGFVFDKLFEIARFSYEIYQKLF